MLENYLYSPAVFSRGQMQVAIFMFKNINDLGRGRNMTTQQWLMTLCIAGHKANLFGYGSIFLVLLWVNSAQNLSTDSSLVLWIMLSYMGDFLGNSHEVCQYFSTFGALDIYQSHLVSQRILVGGWSSLN